MTLAHHGFLFESYKCKNFLPKERLVVKRVIDRVYFLQHPHYHSLSCLAYPIRAVREKTVERLLNIRKREGNTTQSTVHVIEHPVDHFEASHFSEKIS